MFFKKFDPFFKIIYTIRGNFVYAFSFLRIFKKDSQMEKINILRERIIHHALEKFRSEGFAKITMDELAQEMGMSKKTIYQAFPSKNALVENVITTAMQHVKSEIVGTLQGKSNVLEKFSNLVHVVSGITHLYGNIWWKDIRKHMPHMYQKIVKLRHKMMSENLDRLMSEGREAGYFLPFPREYITAVFITTISAVADPANFTQFGLHLSNLAPISLEILINGILTEKGRKTFYKLVKKKDPNISIYLTQEE